MAINDGTLIQRPGGGTPTVIHPTAPGYGGIDSPIIFTTTLTGTIQDIGMTNSIVENGFCYSLNDPPSINDTKITVSPTVQSGTFSSNITSLGIYERYYMSSYHTTGSTGAYYSEVKELKRPSLIISPMTKYYEIGKNTAINFQIEVSSGTETVVGAGQLLIDNISKTTWASSNTTISYPYTYNPQTNGLSTDVIVQQSFGSPSYTVSKHLHLRGTYPVFCTTIRDCYGATGYFYPTDPDAHSFVDQNFPNGTTTFLTRSVKYNPEHYVYLFFPEFYNIVSINFTDIIAQSYNFEYVELSIINNVYYKQYRAYLTNLTSYECKQFEITYTYTT